MLATYVDDMIWATKPGCEWFMDASLRNIPLENSMRTPSALVDARLSRLTFVASP